MLDSRVGNSAIPYELRDVNPKPYQRCNQVYLIAGSSPVFSTHFTLDYPMLLTQEQILEINRLCPSDQGIFEEGNGIPLHIKEACIYSRYHSGGRPGSCYDDENTVNEEWSCGPPHDHFQVIDIILSIICPNISEHDRRLIDDLIDSNTDTDYGYYGDYEQWTVEFIILSDLYSFLINHKLDSILN